MEKKDETEFDIEEKNGLQKKAEKILKVNYKKKAAVNKSKEWFKQKIREILLPATHYHQRDKLTPDSFYKNKTGNVISSASQIQPGSLYCWYYNAKMKDKLPYWDAFPLSFILNLYPDGFLGINLHYLPLEYRTQLMNKIIKYSTDKKYTKNTKLNINYGILKNAVNFPETKVCLKRYLFSHITSKMIVIPATEWLKTAFLPLEHFQKQSLTNVWEDSKQKMR